MCDLNPISCVALLMVACLVLNCSGHAGHSHHQAEPGTGQNKFHDPKVVRDAEHIKEHFEGVAEFNESAMSPEELEFHYFKLHDFDNNTKLDGLEILAALSHMMPYEAEAVDIKGKTPVEVSKIKVEKKDEEMHYYTDIIDAVLKEDDLNQDGYLTYLEYVIARRRDEMVEQQEKRKQDKKT